MKPTLFQAASKRLSTQASPKHAEVRPWLRASGRDVGSYLPRVLVADLNTGSCAGALISYNEENDSPLLEIMDEECSIVNVAPITIPTTPQDFSAAHALLLKSGIPHFPSTKDFIWLITGK